jgi:hypothetical protein
MFKVKIRSSLLVAALRCHATPRVGGIAVGRHFDVAISGPALGVAFAV